MNEEKSNRKRGTQSSIKRRIVRDYILCTPLDIGHYNLKKSDGNYHRKKKTVYTLGEGNVGV